MSPKRSRATDAYGVRRIDARHVRTPWIGDGRASYCYLVDINEGRRIAHADVYRGDGQHVAVLLSRDGFHRRPPEATFINGFAVYKLYAVQSIELAKEALDHEMDCLAAWHLAKRLLPHADPTSTPELDALAAGDLSLSPSPAQ